jgi:hypothetical protein
MSSLLRSIGLSIFILFSFSSIASSEDITITTYYPSPYGSYRELRATRVAIGDNYIDSSQYCWGGGCTNTIDANADLVVEGNVEIGTVTSQHSLAVAGTAGTGGRGIHLVTNDEAIWGTNTNGSITRMLFYGADNNVYLVSVPNSIVFRTGGDGTFFNRIIIDPAGNLGVGIMGPTAKLDVNGNAYVGGGSGVTATIFRDLNTAYFLNPDAGGDTAQSAEIRGTMRIGRTAEAVLILS